MKNFIKTISNIFKITIPKTLGKIFFSILIVLLLYFVVSGIYSVSGPWFFNNTTIAYKTSMDDQRTLVSVENVIKEKGQEDIYVLSFGDGRLTDNVEIPFSVYEEYIGEGNNVLTYQYEEIDFYVADAFFGLSFDNSKIFRADRYRFPWENKNITFSTNEIENFKTVLVKNGNRLEPSDLSFEVDNFYTGYCHVNAIKKYNAIKWSDKINER